MFDGYMPEGATSYTTNGLNQYEDTAAAPLLANGAVDPNPSPETVVATSYQYNANGSLSDTGRWQYVYDVENRLVQARDTVDGVALQFQYDGKGRRIAKLVDQNTTGPFSADIEYEYLYEGDEPIQDCLMVLLRLKTLRHQLVTGLVFSVNKEAEEGLGEDGLLVRANSIYVLN